MLLKITLGRCTLAKSVGRISAEGLIWQNLLTNLCWCLGCLAGGVEVAVSPQC